MLANTLLPALLLWPQEFRQASLRAARQNIVHELQLAPSSPRKSAITAPPLSHRGAGVASRRSSAPSSPRAG